MAGFPTGRFSTHTPPCAQGSLLPARRWIIPGLEEGTRGGQLALEQRASHMPVDRQTVPIPTTDGLTPPHFHSSLFFSTNTSPVSIFPHAQIANTHFRHDTKITPRVLGARSPDIFLFISLFPVLFRFKTTYYLANKRKEKLELQ